MPLVVPDIIFATLKAYRGQQVVGEDIPRVPQQVEPREVRPLPEEFYLGSIQTVDVVAGPGIRCVDMEDCPIEVAYNLF